MSSNKTTANKELNNIEKKSIFPKIVLLVVSLGVLIFGAWYLLSNPASINETQSGTETGNATEAESATITSGNPATPTEAYKKLYAAVKGKDKATIKSMMSKDSIGLGQMQAGQTKKDIDEVLANGFFTANMSDKLPAIRDERIKGKFGAVEVFSQKKNDWEDIPFVIEGGAWKLAVGNMFAGTFESPGTPRTIVEKENANAAGKTDMIPYGNGNVNTNIKPKVIDPSKGEILPAMPEGGVPKPKKP